MVMPIESIETFLRLAIQIADQLASLHAENRLHLSLSPRKIHISGDFSTAVLKGDGTEREALTSHKPWTDSTLPAELAAYASPEQSGRVSAMVDTRSDLYSLGILFYEMLTGHLPFRAASQADMIYAHLTETPVTVHQQQPQVPRILSDLVERLMEKDPGYRYQTAQSLSRDLKRCAQTLYYEYGTALIPAFPLDQESRLRERTLPMTLVGRDQEMARLLDLVAEVTRTGKPRSLYLSGESGVGKTTLVHALAEVVKGSEVLFLHGKFDQFKTSTPYSALIQAITGYFDQILVQEKEKVGAWRINFLTRMREHASYLQDLFPGLMELLGEGIKPGPAPLPMSDAQARLNHAMLALVKTVAPKKQPVILFLDDMQWADASTIRLLEFFSATDFEASLLFLGAYRSEAMGPGHPLSPLLPLSDSMSLENLDQQEVHRLVSRMLQEDSVMSQRLSWLCFIKTGGNPLFLRQYVSSLIQEGVLQFGEEQGRWIMQKEQYLEQEKLQVDLSDLMLDSLALLSAPALSMMKAAACLNSSFDTDLILTILEWPQETLDRALQEAVELRLLTPMQNQLYRFDHDSVQQAVYSLLREEEKIRLHGMIGIALLEREPQWGESEGIFDLAEHLNQAVTLLVAQGKGRLLAEVNLEAGRRASDYAAYDRAIQYLSHGIQALGARAWEEEYDLVLELSNEAARAAYLTARYDLMERFAQTVFHHAKNLWDQTFQYELRIESLTVRNRQEEAVEAARQFLEPAGISLPATPTRMQILWEYLKVRKGLLGKSLLQLEHLPVNEDPRIQSVMRILISAGLSVYTSSDELLLLVILSLLKLSLGHGNSPLSPIAYAGYGHFLSTVFKQRRQGYEFGRLAVRLQERIGIRAYDCRITLFFGILLQHNQEPLRNTLEYFPNTHRNGLAAGDLPYAGHSIMQHIAHLFMTGEKLPRIVATIRESRQDLLKSGHQASIGIVEVYERASLNLQEMEDRELTTENTEDKPVLSNYYLVRMAMETLHGKWEEAEQSLQKMKAVLDGATGTFIIPLYQFYGALISLGQIHPGLGILRKRALLDRAKRYLRTLEGYRASAPQNHENKCHLIQAELHRVAGQEEKALVCYEKSIRAARKNGFLPEEAMALEGEARLLQSMGKRERALRAAREATSCYAAWGCPRKADQVREAFALPREGLDLVDMEALIRISQSISEEMAVDALLARIIRIVLQHAGARKAVFLMERNGELLVEAEGSSYRKEVRVNQGEPVTSRGDLPHRLINYVINSKKSLMLNEETELADFLEDEERSHKPLSIFCIPVGFQGGFSGILYLEHDLMYGAFTEQHAAVLKIIASQLAITLENAKVYQYMEEIIEFRTDQVRAKNQELEIANSRLEEASRYKDRFLASVSHEMRTPLQGVIGMAELLKKSEVAADQKESVNGILTSANALLEIINEILDYSKIRASKIQLEQLPLDLEEMMDQMVSVYQPQANQKGIQFAYSLSNAAEGVLLGDPLWIRNIINNLLSNAFKFTEQGSVTLDLAVEPTGPDQVQLTFQVTDTGIGIPEDKLEQVFQEFTQADDSTARRYGGTGLGLSIVKSMVEEMGGRVAVSSVPQQGSCFTCRIPLSRIAEERNGEPRLAGLSVLLAEDDPISGRYLRAMMTHHGCQVTLVQDGAQTLAALEAGPYHVILMDKNMPVLDGIEATRRIRERERELEQLSGSDTGSPQIILGLTASGVEGDRERLMEAGMDDCLFKPISEARLIQLLWKAKSGLDQENQRNAEPWIEESVFLAEAESFGKAVMVENIEEFLSTYSSMLERIDTLLEQGESMAVSKEIHRLASTISCFYSHRLVSELKGLERLLLEGTDGWGKLETQYLQCKSAISEMVEELKTLEYKLKKY